MANPHRGAVALKAGDRDYTLSFSVNALCELEDAVGKSVNEIVDDLNAADTGASISMKTVRLLIWAALIDHHEGITQQEAGNITIDVDVATVMQKVGEAISRAFPDQPEAKDGARPRKAKA